MRTGLRTSKFCIWGVDLHVRAGVADAVDAYVFRVFKEGTTRASLCFNQSGHLQIDISCINLNFTSYWGGEWQSQWCVDTQNSCLYGSIKINNHYFEAGNIQFNLDRKFDAVPLAAADGPGIVAAIEKLETAHQMNIEELQEGLQDGILKRMRRRLPVTGQKFDWDNAKAMLL